MTPARLRVSETAKARSEAEIGRVLGISATAAAGLVETAIREMAASVTDRVRIIGEEAIIAMDIQDIVSEVGHSVTGIARTRDEAVALASRERPDLIHADIQFADNSSGIDAVNEIHSQFGAQFGAMPVIVITVFPERLQAGERPKPAFPIAKPFSGE